MKNPLQGAFIAHNQKPTQAPHAKGLHRPTQKQQVRHKGRPAVEMPRSHGARASAKGRDSLMGNTVPGMKEPSGIVRAGPGAMRFGDQGLGR